MAEELPLGGNLNDAVRVGDTVRRRAGPWTPAVHELLRFLEREGFPAPRARGMDKQGREILEYLNGEAHAGTPVPLPDSVFREDHMIGAARLLRRYHDLVARFAPSPGATWRLVGPSPHELICHNDWSPWNALFRNGQFALTLDWISRDRARASGTSRTRHSVGFRSSPGPALFPRSASGRGGSGSSATRTASKTDPI